MTRIDLIRSLVLRRVGPTHLKTVAPVVIAPVLATTIPTLRRLPKISRPRNISVDKRREPVLIHA